MATGNGDTFIKTAVLQTTASKGTSCFTKQTLKLREVKSIVILNMVSFHVFFFLHKEIRCEERRKGIGSKCERGLAVTKTKCEKSGDTGGPLYIYLTTLLRGSVLDKKEKQSPIKTHTKQTPPVKGTFQQETPEQSAERVGPWKSLCGRWGTQGWDSPQIKTRFFQGKSLRGVQLNSLSGIQRGGRGECKGADGT